MKIKCPRCNSNLKWYDTIEAEGSIFDGYLTEYQEWKCPCCNGFFNVQVNATLTIGNITAVGVTNDCYSNDYEAQDLKQVFEGETSEDWLNYINE